MSQAKPFAENTTCSESMEAGCPIHWSRVQNLSRILAVNKRDVHTRLLWDIDFSICALLAGCCSITTKASRMNNSHVLRTICFVAIDRAQTALVFIIKYGFSNFERGGFKGY